MHDACHTAARHHHDNLAERLYRMAQHPKSLIALDRADHLLLEREDAEYAGRLIAAWFGRYLS